MATTYFLDLTPAAAGFGTGTGNWTGASNWTTSNTGASGTNVTWPGLTTDSVSFGASGTALTAGTLTVNSNVTVAGITTGNVSGSVTINTFSSNVEVGQYITGSGTISLASTSTVTATVGAMFIDAPISATGSNHTFSSTGSYVLNLSGTGTTGITGTVNVTSGKVRLLNNVNSQTFFGSGATINISPGASVTVNAWATANCTINGSFAGSGNLVLADYSTYPLYCTFTGSLTGLTQSFVFSAAASNIVNCTTSTLPVSGRLDLNSTFTTGSGITVLASGNPSYLSAGVVTYTNFPIYSSGTSGFTIIGNFQMNAVGNYGRADLRGTATGNVIAGNMVNLGGSPLARKRDAGSWQVNGTGTGLSGGIFVEGGTYIARNASVTDGTASVTVSAGATFGISGGFTTFNAPINLSGTFNNVADTNTYPTGITVAANTAVIRAESGALTCTGSITLSNALTVGHVSDAGDITWSAASPTGSGAITKAGPRDLVISVSMSGATGAFNLNAGKLVALNAPSTIPPGVFTFTGSGLLEFRAPTTFRPQTVTRSFTHAAAATGGFTTGSLNPAGVYVTYSGTVTLSATSNLALAGEHLGYNTITTAFAGSSAAGITKSDAGRWVLMGANNLSGTTNVNAGTLVASNNSVNSKLLGGTVNVNAGGRIQLSADGTQKGRCTYTQLVLNGTAGSRSRIRIGGVDPRSITTFMNTDLLLPTSGTTTWDVSNCASILKSPGTYTLIAWISTTRGITAGSVTSNVTLTGVPAGMTCTLAYDTVSSPKRITITSSY